MSAQAAALADIAGERRRQDERWGEQNHPYWSPSADAPDEGAAFQSYRALWADVSTAWKQANAHRVNVGVLAWDGILLEEVYEALAEEDSERRIEELTQVAAVAVAMIEAIRRGGTT